MFNRVFAALWAADMGPVFAAPQVRPLPLGGPPEGHDRAVPSKWRRRPRPRIYAGVMTTTKEKQARRLAGLVKGRQEIGRVLHGRYEIVTPRGQDHRP